MTDRGAQKAELALLDALVTSITEARAAISSLQALELTLLSAADALAGEQTARLASSDSRDRDMPRRAVAAEIGTATRASDRTVQRRMGEASALTRDFPLAVRALGAGRIERGHLAVIFETGGSIADASARADFERAAIALAERETPGRLRPLLRSIAGRLDPTSIDIRHAEANKRRSVWVSDLDDGMAQLIATLPAAIAHAIRDRLTRFARSVVDARDDAAPGTEADAARDDRTGPVERDSRTIEQLRADVLADLLLAGDPTAPPRSPEPIVAPVQVIVASQTITGPALSDRDEAGGVTSSGTPPPELLGRGPIDSVTARHLVATATGWDRLLVDPVNGGVLSVDRYRPSAHQRRLLRARDERCRFPGCRIPVHRCDIDHTVDAALGGETSTCNLAHLCRRHHSLKHDSDWTVRQRPDGSLEWTSPTGRIHVDQAPGTVRFRASLDPPPF